MLQADGAHLAAELPHHTDASSRMVLYPASAKAGSDLQVSACTHDVPLCAQGCQPAMALCDPAASPRVPADVSAKATCTCRQPSVIIAISGSAAPLAQNQESSSASSISCDMPAGRPRSTRLPSEEAQHLRHQASGQLGAGCPGSCQGSRSGGHSLTLGPQGLDGLRGCTTRSSHCRGMHR